MVRLTHRIKHIVTASAVTCLLSAPLLAQTVDIDQLYDELAQTDTPEAAARIAGQINAQWERSGSPAMDLLLRRGKDALDDGEYDAALDHFSALVDHAPDFAEGYYGRASAYFLLGLTGPALDDIGQVLAMNPRHYEAMGGLAVIMEELQRPDDALALYNMVLAIHPTAPEATEAVARLKLALEGQSL